MCLCGYPFVCLSCCLCGHTGVSAPTHIKPAQKRTIDLISRENERHRCTYISASLPLSSQERTRDTGVHIYLRLSLSLLKRERETQGYIYLLLSLFLPQILNNSSSPRPTHNNNRFHLAVILLTSCSLGAIVTYERLLKQGLHLPAITLVR